MAKGQDSKNMLFKALMEKYPNSFWEDENKILRVPFNEGGSRIEIKVQLTAAKVNLRESDNDNMATFGNDSIQNSKGSIEFKTDIEPSQEELANVQAMLKALDL